MLVILAAASAETAPNPGFLRQAGLLEDDLEKVSRGQVAARVLDTDDRREVVTVGFLRVRSTKARFLECIRDPGCLEGSEDLIAAGRLEWSDLVAANSPRSPLMEMPLDERELKQLRECRLRHCDLRLAGEAIAALGRIDWAEMRAAPEAARLFREALFDYARRYVAGGNQALPVYEDGPEPVALAGSLEGLLERPLAPLNDAPALRRYLTAFPAERPPDTNDFLTWAKEKAWFKRVIAIQHVMVQDRSRPEGDAILVASKQLYASQCYESAVRVLWFECPAGTDRASLVFVSRAQADVRPSGFTWMERLLLRRLITRRLLSQLRLLKERLEARPAGNLALK
jgi:hypothetical protein